MPTVTLPLCKPRLPDASAVLPWLRQIDAARIYSNHGPLETRFRAGLRDHFGGQHVLTVANCTIGLSLALRLAADRAPAGALVMVPAFTFVATALAVRQAGLIPWLVDVDVETWALTPALAQAHLARAPGPVAAVMPVAPFGAHADARLWDAFSTQTGVPVVVDAAASFDRVTPGACATVVSLHATKAFGIGEGGVVVTTDESLADRLTRLTNFGFTAARTSVLPGTNGKISEYTAAVGLAMFDLWPQVRDRLRAVAAAYQAALRQSPAITPAPGLLDGTPSTMNVRLAMDCDPVMEGLAARGIGARRWWGMGLAAHPSLADCPATELPVTTALARNVLGLPLTVDMTDADVQTVVTALRALSGAIQ